MKTLRHLLILSTLFLCPFASATVQVNDAKPGPNAAVASTPGQPRSVDPATAEMPSTEKRPLGTAIGGASSTSPITRQGEASLSMKCWQNGKLIIDQPVKAPPADAQKGAAMTNATTGNSVYAFDFKNAMCVVK